MAEGEKIGAAYVDIGADLSTFDAAMAALPAKASSKIDAAMKALQAKVAQNKIDFKVALNTGTAADIARLGAEQEKLEAKIASVTRAAINQAQAMQQAARMGQSGASVLREIHAEAAAQANASGQAVVASYGRAAGAAGRFGQTSRQAGMTGAMGLMVLSQTIDDAQYGFRSIVNNIPQVGMAVGSMLGMSLEASMKLGAIAGIAAVAVNLLITHWDKLMKAMGLDTVKTEAEQMEALEKSTARTADETERLNRYKAEQAKIEQMLSGRPGGEKRTAEAVQHAFDEADPKKVMGTLAAHMRPEMTPEQRAEVVRTERDARSMAQSYGAGSELAREAAGRRDEARRKIDEKLNAEAITAAGKLMVRAKAAGPEGDQARAELRTKVAANPQAFHPDLPRMLEEAAPPKLKPGFNSIEEQLRQEAIEQGGRENERAFAARQRKEAAEFDKEALEVRAAENARLADVLRGGAVGRNLLRPGGMTPEMLHGQVREALGKAGMSSNQIDAAVEGVATKLREKVDKQVRDRAIDREVSPEVARRELLREAEKEAKDERIKAGGPKAEVLSDKSLFDKLMLAGFGSAVKDEIPRQALDEAKTGNKKLDEVVKAIKEAKPDGIARVARGPARR